MLKKIAAYISIIALAFAGLVAMSMPASATAPSHPATLDNMELHGDFSSFDRQNVKNNKWENSIAIQNFNTDQTFYDVVSSDKYVRIYALPTDPSATITITGDGQSSVAITTGHEAGVESNTTYLDNVKHGTVRLAEAINQMIHINVTTSDDTKIYDLQISYARTPQVKVISNSLTSVSTAGGTQGVLYAKNYTQCSAVFFVYKYVDADGYEQTEWDRVDSRYINTDSNGISKVTLTNREPIMDKYRDSSIVADLVITNGSTYVSDRSGSLTWQDNQGGYSACSLWSESNTSVPYAETVVKSSIHYFNPTVASTTMPATISQHTAFTVSGPGITAYNDQFSSNVGVYFLDETTGGYYDNDSNYLDGNTTLINNNSLLVTVDGSTADYWKTDHKLKMFVVQWGTCDYWENIPCLEDTVLYSKDVNFTPEMATQVAVSPAKGPVAGGNKVTITGHGLVNPSKWSNNPECTWTDPAHPLNPCPFKNQVAYITIGGNPVTDLHVTASDFYTSSDKLNWDGIAKATFLVPAGAAGKADITIDMGYGPVTLTQQYVYGAKPTVTSVTPSTVATTGGSMITLAGTNFGLSGTPTVIIDGVKSPYVVRSSATKVTAMVPEHTGTGAVSLNIISSSGGGGLDTPATLTYAAATKNPTLTTITPATDGVSGGASVTFTGIGFDKTATGVMFGANPAKITAATATSLTVDVPTGDQAGAVNVVVGTPTGIVTKTNGFTYVADNGVTSVSPTVIASTTPSADAKVTITGVGFGTAGKITVGSAAAINYSSNGTTIPNIAIPTSAAGTIAISILPTGKTKAYTSSVKVTGPKITFVGPQNLSDDSNVYFGDSNPWEGSGYGIPAAPANSAGEVITVLGSGFGNAGTLKIGATTVTTTLYSDTLVTFIAPSAFAAGDYDVQVVPAVGSLTATLANAITIGKQLATPVITKIEAPAVPNLGNGDPTGLNTFWPGNLSESDLYTITGVGFLGSDNGAATSATLTYYDNTVGDNVTFNLSIEGAISDTSMQVHLPRTIPAYDYENGGTWTFLKINTNETVISLDQAIPYMEYAPAPQPEPSYSGSLNPYEGLCATSPVASDGTTYAVTTPITWSDSSNPFGSVKGSVTLGGYTIPPLKITTWNESTITFNLSGSNIPQMWGVQTLAIRPDGAPLDGSGDIITTFNCHVNTSVTTKIDGLSSVTKAAGVAFAPTATMNNKIGSDTFTEPANGYEFQSATSHGAQFGWASGLPKAAGDYYVRAKLLTADYDRIKYNITSIGEVHVTITGTDITLTPKLVAGGSSLTYKGQLGDGTNGTNADIGYNSSIVPTDAITSVTYKYRNSACTGNESWAIGLPKNVAGNVCTGTSTGTGSWTIQVFKYAMIHNGEDMTYKYNATFPTFVLTINKKEVTLSTVKAEKVYDGTTSVTLKDITMTGAIVGEDPLLDGSFARGAQFADATAGTNKPVTLGGDFKLAGIYANNYTITNPQMPVTGIIKKANAELKVVPEKTSLVIGVIDSTALTFTNKDTVTHADPISDAGITAPVWANTTTSICTLSSDNSTVTAVAGGDCVIRITQPASTNYNAGIAYHDPTSTTEELVIKVFGSPKDVSVVADDIKVAVGSPLDPSISATGLLDGDSFDGTLFDYYQGSTKLDSAPTAIGTYKIVPRGGSITAANSAAYNVLNTKYIPGKLVITPAPPVITAIEPAHGPEAGGNTVTISGTGLAAVTSISLGDVTIRKPLFTLNGDGTKITFVVPAGTGGMDIILNAGTAEADSFYTYDSSNTPGAIPGVTEDLTLKLALKLAVGSKISGQNVGIQGGGLQPNSTYTLVMHSKEVLLYTGTSDADGNFNESVKIPATACLAAGLHELVLTGITPAGEPTSDTAKFTLVDGCKVGATAVATADNEWTLSGFLFGYMSSKLTKGGKSSLKALKKLLKGAKHITITGYTQTNVKSKAEKAFNKKLAKARTVSVQRYLKSLGLKTKWTLVGAGAVNPVSIKYQGKNRRVVIRATY